MKALLTLLALVCGINSFAREFKVSATSQSWAGGICCRHGVNYTVTVNTGKLNIDSVKIQGVCMDNKRYTHSFLTLTKTKHSFTVSFGYTISWQSVTQDDILANSSDKKYNNSSSENQKPCEENQIVFKLNGEIFTLKIENVEQLFPLAYP